MLSGESRAGAEGAAATRAEQRLPANKDFLGRRGGRESAARWTGAAGGGASLPVPAPFPGGRRRCGRGGLVRAGLHSCGWWSRRAPWLQVPAGPGAGGRALPTCGPGRRGDGARLRCTRCPGRAAAGRPLQAPSPLRSAHRVASGTPLAPGRRPGAAHRREVSGGGGRGDHPRGAQHPKYGVVGAASALGPQLPQGGAGWRRAGCGARPPRPRGDRRWAGAAPLLWARAPCCAAASPPSLLRRPPQVPRGFADSSPWAGCVLRVGVAATSCFVGAPWRLVRPAGSPSALPTRPPSVRAGERPADGARGFPGRVLRREAEAGGGESHFLLSDGQAGLAGHAAGPEPRIPRVRGRRAAGWGAAGTARPARPCPHACFHRARNYAGAYKEWFQKGGFHPPEPT